MRHPQLTHSPILFHFVKSSPSLTASPMHPSAAPSELDSVKPVRVRIPSIHVWVMVMVMVV